MTGPVTAAIVARRPVIGFAALSGSGKSRAAAVLGRLEPVAFVTIAFAAPIKDALRAMGLEGEALAGEALAGEAKERPHPLLQGRSPRYAMRTLGTEWGRELIGPGLWTGLWRRRAMAVLADGAGVVADDVRFADEAEVIHELGGVVVRIVRPGIAQDTSHISEAQGFAADVTIVNDGPAAHFDRVVQHLGVRVLRGEPIAATGPAVTATP